MSWIRGLGKQLRVLFGKEEVEAELNEELRYHLERETQKNVAAGMSTEEARRSAVLAFGGVERWTEEVRDARWTRVVEDVIADLRVSVRALRRQPGFTAAVIMTVALGVGGITAIYSVVRSALLEPLPYPESERLVRLYQFNTDSPADDLYVSGVHFKEYRERASFLDAVAAVYTYDETGADLVRGDVVRRVRTLRVTPDYFRVLSVTPTAGRGFGADEEHGDPVAVVSAELASRLGAGAVGSAIELDGRPITVVGVMPAGWRDPLVGTVDVWMPENLHSGMAESPGNHYLSVLGRLAEGTTLERARSEATALDRRLAESYPTVADNAGFRLRSLREDIVAGGRPTLLLLFLATILVLIIACVNVANLQTARALGRARLMAVRSALGASRGRIARQVLTESLLLAGIGGLIGLGVAFVGLEALLALGGDSVPRADEVTVDGAVLFFALMVTVGVGVTFGLAPALRLSATAPGGALREGGRGTAGGRRASRAHGTLVAGQVALAMVLLVGAGTLAASVYRLSRVDLGVRTERLLSFELNLPESRYDADRRGRFHDDLSDQLAAQPGVRSAAAVSWPPVGGDAYSWGVHTHAGPRASTDEGPTIYVAGRQRVVTDDYFDVLGIPLLEGRLFDGRDTPDAELAAAVVSRGLAEELFPGMSALGQEIHMGGVARVIVGVVDDVAATVEGDAGAVVYHLHRQYADRAWSMTYLLATEAAPLAALPAVRRVVASADPALVVHEPEPFEATLADARGRRSFAFVLTAVFAALALALAVVGVYGVLAHRVGQRRREIGIRLALGAAPGNVARAVVTDGMVPTLVGLGAGVLGALAGGRLLEALVFETQPTDPVILGTAAAGLLLAAFVAALIPGVRAARIEPSAVLAQD